MDGEDVFGVVRTALTTALDQAAAAARPAADALAAARSAVERAQGPDAWSDVLAWALARVAALDPRLELTVEGSAITLRFTDAGGTAAVSVAAYAGTASPAVVVSVQGSPRLGLPVLEVSGAGAASWRIDGGGPAAPTGTGSLVVTLTVPVDRVGVAEAGARVGVGGHVVAVVRLGDAEPVWALSIAAPGVSAEVDPAALLGMSGLPHARAGFAPRLDVQQGGTPQLAWSAS